MPKGAPYLDTVNAWIQVAKERGLYQYWVARATREAVETRNREGSPNVLVLVGQGCQKRWQSSRVAKLKGGIQRGQEQGQR